MKILAFLTIYTFATAECSAQTDSLESFSICGSVISSGDSTPIAGCRVKLAELKAGPLTDTNGKFCLHVLKGGSHTLIITAYGHTSLHQTISLWNRDTFITFLLTQRPISADTIEVQASRVETEPSMKQSAKVHPSLVTISDSNFNTPFSIYEDPSRIAQTFAGVSSSSAINNEIVVRGGSPNEVLWKLDGMDIPNPNHFARAGTAGGVLSAINPTMLSNGDFYSGAFPAEFGSRLSAVYDLHTRDGNLEQWKWSAQVSFIGLEGSVEGPIGTSGSSLLMGVRYSTLQMLQNTGALNLSSIPSFDDLNTKMHFILSPLDTLNMTALWGSSTVDLAQRTDQVSSGSGVDAIGLRWLHSFLPSTSMEVAVSKVDNSYRDDFDTLASNQKEGYVGARIGLSYRSDSTTALNFGLEGRREQLPTIAGTGTDSSLISPATNYYSTFGEWIWTPVKWISLNSGVYSQYLAISNQSSIEPRESLTFHLGSDHSLWLAYGLHRQPELLQFVQADHFVAGYSYNPDPTLLFKIEGYQKYYSHAPIDAQSDAFSLLNSGVGTDDNYSTYVYAGKGKVTGAEMTWSARNDASYALITASYVHQQYLASDGIWRDGAFDSRFIFNVVSGETVHFRGTTTLTLTEKLVVVGGNPYTPIDLAASASAGTTILDSSQTLGARNPPYIRLDVGVDVGLKWNSMSIDIYLNVLNALGINNILDRYYDTYFKDVDYDYDLPFVPILGIRVTD